MCAKVFFLFLSDFGLRPKWEAQGLLVNGPGEKRPDLECVDPLDPTLRVLIDIQITSPCSTSLFQVASSKPLHAAEQAEKAKHRKYDRHLRPGYKLVPFVLEVYGAWGKEAIRFASSLATKAPSVDKIGTNIPSPSSTGSLVRVSAHSRDLFQLQRDISVALQRGNNEILLQYSERERRTD